MKKEIICTICPIGCNISVDGEGEAITSVKGYSCKRGVEYARNEFSHPVRILTTTVKVAGSDQLLPVRSNKPIPKEMIMDCMEVIKKITASSKVKRYDVIIPDICGSSADIVATGSLETERKQIVEK
jgi:CxxC motif-containing protein